MWYLVQQTQSSLSSLQSHPKLWLPLQLYLPPFLPLPPEPSLKEPPTALHTGSALTPTFGDPVQGNFLLEVPQRS